MQYLRLSINTSYVAIWKHIEIVHRNLLQRSSRETKEALVELCKLKNIQIPYNGFLSLSLSLSTSSKMKWRIATRNKFKFEIQQQDLKLIARFQSTKVDHEWTATAPSSHMTSIVANGN
ncbi:hypothetical protein ACB094_09G082500 [Castanea mollissima]